MDYNTFEKVLDMDIDIEKNKQCIICLEQTPILLSQNDNVTLLNDMHFLIKECECLCYAHHKCIEKWIATNAVCPICKKIVSFPVMTLSNKAVLVDLPNSTIVQNNAIAQNSSISHLCISTIISIFFVLIILQIIIRY